MKCQGLNKNRTKCNRWARKGSHYCCDQHEVNALAIVAIQQPREYPKVPWKIFLFLLVPVVGVLLTSPDPVLLGERCPSLNQSAEAMQNMSNRMSFRAGDATPVTFALVKVYRKWNGLDHYLYRCYQHAVRNLSTSSRKSVDEHQRTWMSLVNETCSLNSAVMSWKVRQQVQQQHLTTKIVQEHPPWCPVPELPSVDIRYQNPLVIWTPWWTSLHGLREPNDEIARMQALYQHSYEQWREHQLVNDWEPCLNCSPEYDKYVRTLHKVLAKFDHAFLLYYGPDIGPWFFQRTLQQVRTNHMRVAHKSFKARMKLVAWEHWADALKIHPPTHVPAYFLAWHWLVMLVQHQLGLLLKALFLL